MSGDIAFPLLRWRAFAVALVAVAAVLATAWVLNPPIYFTNDDVSIRLALEGTAIPGQPATGFSILTHAALGWSIVALNTMLPSVPWWDLVVAGTLIWALAVFVALAWDALGSAWPARATAVGALLVTAVPVASALQFTISATLAGGAAALLGLTELGASRPARSTVLAMAAVLLLVGLLVRGLAAAAGLAAVVLFLGPVFAARELWRPRLVAALVAAGLLILSVQYVDGLLYSLNRDWDAYYRYNGMIARLFEGGGEPSDSAGAVRASTGWSSNDWMMLQAYFGVDRAVHGFDQLAKAYNARASLIGWDGTVRGALERAADIDAADLRRLLGASASVLAVIAAVGLYVRRGGLTRGAATAVLFCVLCFAIEVVFKELPFRVLAPLHLCLVAAILVIAGVTQRVPSPVVSVLGLGVVVAVLTAQIGATVTSAEAEYKHSQQVTNEVMALERLSPSLLVLHADTFPREHWWRPFQHPRIALPAIALGWNNQNPLLQRFLSSSGREPLLKAICSDPGIFVIAEEGRLDFVTTYLQERYDTNVRWTDVFDGSFHAWRCDRS
jgi:hypothetical protein